MFHWITRSRARRHAAGSNPRACAAALLFCAAGLFATPSLHAATFCVQTTIELNDALANVSTGGAANASDSTIHVASGTLTTSGSAFLFTTASGHSLTIDGGWNATCSTQDLAPAKTMLDGGGLTQAFSAQTNGALTLSHLTFQNGVRNGSSNGGGVGVTLNHLSAGDPTPLVVFDANIVRNNTTDHASGGMTVFATAPMGSSAIGIVHVENSIFANNSAPSVGALFIDLGPGSEAYLTNNTFSANTSSSPGTTVTAIGDPSGALTGYVSNTISYGNTADFDFSLYFDDSVLFTNNDYVAVDGTLNAGSVGNMVNVDPKFVGSGDYHLSPNSPLINAGSISPPGTLPVTDIAGQSRTFANRVDLGAYERGDRIFANGFQAP